VERAIGLLRAEVERSLALLGCRALAELRPSHVAPVSPAPASAPASPLR
jgi:isopentenyl diphosphate isomerase/L-lactate dehydrogenase-like FMN-dependent dehydrogenase